MNMFDFDEVSREWDLRVKKWKPQIRRHSVAYLFQSAQTKGEIRLSLCYNDHLDRLTTAVFETKNFSVESAPKQAGARAHDVITHKKTISIKRTYTLYIGMCTFRLLHENVPYATRSSREDEEDWNCEEDDVASVQRVLHLQDLRRRHRRHVSERHRDAVCARTARWVFLTSGKFNMHAHVQVQVMSIFV